MECLEPPSSLSSEEPLQRKRLHEEDNVVQLLLKSGTTVTVWKHPKYTNYGATPQGTCYNLQTRMEIGSLNKCIKRWYVQLSYKAVQYNTPRARFVYECKINNVLDSHLQVDHINNTKVDDAMENLQALTPQLHAKKNNANRDMQRKSAKSRSTAVLVRLKTDEPTAAQKYYSVSAFLREKGIDYNHSHLTKRMKTPPHTYEWRDWHFQMLPDLEDFPNEEWFDALDKDGITAIDGWRVSNKGRVHVTFGNRKTFGTEQNGYMFMSKGAKCYRVHNLVAVIFLGPIPEGHTVNHIDHNPLNNSKENLEYATAREQAVHARGVKVNITNANGVTETYDTINDAADALGILRKSIRRRLVGPKVKTNRKLRKHKELNVTLA